MNTRTAYQTKLITSSFENGFVWGSEQTGIKRHDALREYDRRMRTIGAVGPMAEAFIAGALVGAGERVS